MEDKEKLMQEITGQVKSLISDSQEENITKKELDNKIKELNDKIESNLNNKELEELKDSVEKLVASNAENAAALKSFTESKTEQQKKPVDFRSAWKSAILTEKELVLTEKNDDNGKRFSMKDYFEKNGGRSTPAFKASVDMLESNIVGDNVANIRLTELDPNRVGIPLAIYPHVMDWMPSRGIMKPYMSVLVAYDYEDGSGTKTEGSAPSKSSFKFKTIEFKAFYIATYFTLSDETLDDLEEALDEISIVAPDKIKSNVDGQIMGSAGDDSSALAGILTATKHTDFVAKPYANTVKGANKIDAIAKMKLACKANKHNPDVVILNENEIDNIAALKNQLDDSITDRRIRFDALGKPAFVCGLRVIENSDTAENAAIVIDSKQALIGMRKNMTMEIGYNGTDLTEGQKTAIIKVRVAFAIRDKAGVIYSDDLATAVSTIDKGV